MVSMNIRQIMSSCTLLYITLLSVLPAAAQVHELPLLLQKAAQEYPALKAARLQQQITAQEVHVAKNKFNPSLQASYQLNYSTYNNITGMVYPASIIPISGPPSAGNTMSGVFGSATSLLLNWQAITFGQKAAETALAQTAAGVSSAETDYAVLQHSVKTANQYLDLIQLLAQQEVQRENIRRMQILFTQTQSLVAAGLRPGVDTALVRADLVKAGLDLSLSQQQSQSGLIALRQLVNDSTLQMPRDTSFFYNTPAISINYTDSLQHPLLSFFDASIARDKASRNLLSKSTAPSLGVWGTTYARGSGIAYNGSVHSTDGLGFQRYNYGLGLQVSLPLLQGITIRPRLQQHDLQIKADEEKRKETVSQLSSQLQQAETLLQYTQTALKQNQQVVKSAQFAYETLAGRYEAGLANYADLAQASFQWVKAATEIRSNTIAIWKTLLYKAAVTGNLSLFTNALN
jgi:outer membrane protein